MKKNLIALLLVVFAFVNQGFAQQTDKVHKIVFHLATSDTLAHKALAKQVANVLDYWKNAQIEVVVHNNGIGFMKKNGARTGLGTHKGNLQTLGFKGRTAPETLGPFWGHQLQMGPRLPLAEFGQHRLQIQIRTGEDN